jgi:hypothetical protein
VKTRHNNALLQDKFSAKPSEMEKLNDRKKGVDRSLFTAVLFTGFCGL